MHFQTYSAFVENQYLERHLSNWGSSCPWTRRLPTHDHWCHDHLKRGKCIRRPWLSGAEVRQIGLQLASAVDTVIGRSQLTQVAVVAKLSVSQPKISAPANYRLEGFSVGRMTLLLTALDQDVQIVARGNRRSRAISRISVVAA